MPRVPVRHDSIAFTVILGLLAALPSLSLDICIPALLTIQHEMGASSRMIGLTITLFMVGFAVGQCGAGPVSDRLGRRPVLLVGLSSYSFAAMACAVAATAEGLIAWRFIQGIGAGACAVLAFAMIRDLFDGDVARAKRSYVTVVFGLAPVLAPSLGALLLDRVGWRPIFIFLALGGLLLICVTASIGESRPAEARAQCATSLGTAYRRLLADHRFLGLASVNALSFGAIFAYIAGSPMVLMGTLRFSATAYAGFFACTATALTLGAWVSGRLAARGVGPTSLLWFSLPTAAASAAAISAIAATDVRAYAALVPLVLINLFCRGLVAPNAQHLALEPMRANAGAAAAAVGVLQILTGAAASLLVAMLLPAIGPVGMPLVMAGFASAALLTWLWIATPPTTLASATGE